MCIKMPKDLMSKTGIFWDQGPDYSNILRLSEIVIFPTFFLAQAARE